MFLQSLLRRNPQFVEAAVELHQAGRIPANSCVLDLDAIEANTTGLCRQARGLGLVVYAMTKQIGRASGALAAITAGGVDGYVAVDMACARPNRPPRPQPRPSRSSGAGSPSRGRRGSRP